LLESCGFEIIHAGLLNEQFLDSVELTPYDLLLIDQDEDIPSLPTKLAERLGHWHRPVLFNDSMATRLSLLQGDPEFGRLLVDQIYALSDPEAVKQDSGR
jgi:hypothetical protein